MRIVVAPDSFKDSLSAKAVAEAINRGLLMELPDAEVAMCPMADGGEGTIEAILDAVNGERCHAQVTGPLGAPVDASWAWLPNTSTAIIEMAEASGLQLIPRHLRDASRATSFGTGELIAAALDAGAKRIVLTIGGSATNDAGAGMLRALGVRFFGPSACELEEGGLALSELARIDLSGADPRIRDTQFEIAADVDNPLCGPNGASYIFGAQKGASESQIAKLDDSLVHFANECARVLGIDWRDIPGAGAAGGMGFAAKAFFDASFRPGVEVVAELVGLSDKIRSSDLVITGEGRCDDQTLNGKTPLGVARISKALEVPVVILAGTLGPGYQLLYENGVQAVFSIASGPMTLDQACDRAAELLRDRARDVARLWKLGASR